MQFTRAQRTWSACDSAS